MSRIVLVSMPFAPVFSPSLGLSLLKASLTRQGIDATLRYFTIRFAELAGYAVYGGIADAGRPALEDLPGEWLFSAALQGTTEADDERYIEELLRGYYSDARIARLLRARKLVDQFLDDCLDSVLREQPRIVGFTSTFQQHTASLALAQRIKRALPAAFIVFGGANCEGVMGAETVRSFPCVDAAVSGEGDLVFPELVKRVFNGKSVSSLPGVRVRDSVEQDFTTSRFTNAPVIMNLDQLPYPDYSDYMQQFRASRFDRDWYPTVFLETARGCWWGERMHCTFCGLNGATMAFRSKSGARALAEITNLAHRHPHYRIRTVDNILDLGYFKDLIPALAARRRKPRLYWETKSNLHKEQVRLLRDAGIREIQPGIESLSDAVLKLMRKGVSGLENIQLLKWCKELGIDARWNILWGFPGEPPDEYARMAKLVPFLTHLQAPRGYGPLRMDRFSPNFFEAERMGFADVRPVEAYRHVYRLPDGAIANLASYFTYRYREPRDVDVYVRPLARQLAMWERMEGGAALLSAEAGEYTVIVDLRPVRQEPFIVVGGVTRMLYRECDAVRDVFQLAQHVTMAEGVEPASRVEQLLEPLVKRGLLLRDGSRYLSLAIPMGDYVPPPAVRREFSRIVRKLGTPGAHRWIVPAVQIGANQYGSTVRLRRRAGRGVERVRSVRLASCRFSVDARGRLVIRAGEHSALGRRSR